MLAVEQLPHQRSEAFLPFHFCLWSKDSRQRQWFLPWNKPEKTKPSYTVAGNCFYIRALSAATPIKTYSSTYIAHVISVKAVRIHGFPLMCFYTDITVPLQFQLTSSTTHRVFAIVAQIIASNMHRYELPVSTEVNSLCNKENNEPEFL